MIDGAKSEANSSRELLVRKYARLFTLLDIDRDGEITAADITELGRQLATASYGESQTRSGEFSTALQLLWAEYGRSMRGGPDQVSRDDFVATLADFLERQPDRTITLIGHLANVLFTASDTDRDGTIGKDEAIRQGMRFLDVSTAEAEEAWAGVDVQQRGYVDYPQCLTSVAEFITSPDPRAPGNRIFGRP